MRGRCRAPPPPAQVDAGAWRGGTGRGGGRGGGVSGKRADEGQSKLCREGAAVLSRAGGGCWDGRAVKTQEVQTG
jgi:hypothetical protein